MPLQGKSRQAWDDWAKVDPLWAILTEPDNRHGRWDVDEFLESGRGTVEIMLRDAAEFGLPASLDVAIDFGCGVGRLTRPLAKHFGVTYGLDIAPRMIDHAKRLQGGAPGCRFLVHDREDLGCFADCSVDLICCLLVLQHVPSRPGIETYLREFVRVLAPGGIAIVQLPTYVPEPRPPATLRERLALRTRVALALRTAGISPRFLYARLRWTPEMPMTAIPRDDTLTAFRNAGGSVLRVADVAPDDGGVESCIYYVSGRRSGHARSERDDLQPGAT